MTVGVRGTGCAGGVMVGRRRSVNTSVEEVRQEPLTECAIRDHPLGRVTRGSPIANLPGEGDLSVAGDKQGRRQLMSRCTRSKLVCRPVLPASA
jgi:hypothetical protein